MSPTRPKRPSQRAEGAARDDDGARALKRAGAFLARRAHSRSELERKLARSFTPGVVSGVLHRLEEHGLIDDEAMARAWVEERACKRGPAVLIEELRARGIDDALAGTAVAGIDEDETARRLAQGLYRKVSGKPLAAQGPSLAAMLARRGFSMEASEAAARAVLPPEGWD